VAALLDRVVAADAKIFITPGFNYGLPGASKT
jgi:NAD(P)H-dependent FMN reductase